MELKRVMEERHSCRAFSQRGVERDLLEELLRRAGRAPSALNLQPWEVTVVMGHELSRLTRRILKAHRERAVACTPGAVRPLPERFQRRRRESFGPLAQLLDENGQAMEAFVGEGSCGFYGAPVALILCVNRAFSRDRYLCLGAFTGYLVLAAHDLNLATCPVGLIASYGEEIQEQLNIPEDREVALGVALGYPDPASPLAAFATSRDPIDQYVRWFG